MKKKLQKMCVVVVAVAMFAGALLLSMERKPDGKWKFAPAQSFAQSEGGGSESTIGYQSVIITDNGTSGRCIGSTYYRVRSYTSMCIGSGSVPCPGDWEVLTPNGTCGFA